MRIGCVILALLLVVLSGCGESYETREKRETEKRETAVRKEREGREEERRARIVAELRDAYLANDAWSKAPLAWTADVQAALMPSDGKPIVGIARLRDVARQGSGYTIYLEVGDLFFNHPPIEFALQYGDVPHPRRRPEHRLFRGDRVLRRLGDSEYAYVAVIRRVRVLDTHVVATGGPRWVAEGVCLALREIESEAPPEDDTREKIEELLRRVR